MIPLNALFSSLSEGQVSELLDGFRCQRNADIEHFLKHRAIAFEKSNRSRTYLICKKGPIDERPFIILGYFTIAIHLMDASSPSISGNLRKRLAGMFYSPTMSSYHVPCFLIGQLAKNDRFCNEIMGCDIVMYAIDALNIAHVNVGGRFIKVDCEDSVGLIRFYRDNGFVFVQKDPRSGMVEMVMFYRKVDVPLVES